jgi:heterodisulfide reductase subunit C2
VVSLDKRCSEIIGKMDPPYPQNKNDAAVHKKPGSNRTFLGERGNQFLIRLEDETRANISACYQCERCTNACPVSQYMDIKPHQVIRHVQLGWRDQLLGSTAIWVCLSCEMCSTYCPNEVAVSTVISHLRNLAFHSSVHPKEKALALFHQTFLGQLQKFGRVNEFWLMEAINRCPQILKDKIAAGSFKEELLLGWALWRKGKLHLIPRRSKAIKEIKEVYRRHPAGIP